MEIRNEKGLKNDHIKHAENTLRKQQKTQSTYLHKHDHCHDTIVITILI